MTEIPTILILDNSPAITGALKSILSCSNGLKHRYRFVYAIPSESSTNQYVQSFGFKTVRIPYVEISKRPINLLMYIPRLVVNALRLLETIRTCDVRLIHVNDYYNLLGAVVKLIKPSIVLVTHVRRMPESLPKTLDWVWQYVMFTFSDRVIAVSEAVRYQLHRKNAVVTIYDSLPEKEKYPTKNHKSRKTITILYLGNFIRGKGQDLALSAFTKAYRENRYLRLKFIGGDMGLEKNRKFKNELESRVAEMDLTNTVEFREFTYDTEKSIKESDIVLNMSESESFSMTCLEALTYGTPLIASKCGGPSELIEDRIGGFLVDNRNVNQACEAILALATDIELRKKIAKNGRIYVREKFNKQVHVARIAANYDSVMNAEPSSSSS